MIKRTTWILLAVFAALVGVAWILQRSNLTAKSQATPTAEAQLLFNLDANALSSLKIQDGQGKTVELNKDQNGQWKLVEPLGDVADSGQVDSTIRQFASMPVLNQLDPPPPPDATGLITPTYTVTLSSSDSQQHVAKVGAATSTGTSYYVQVNSGSVDVVSKSIVDGVLDLFNNPPLATPTPEASPTPVASETPSESQPSPTP
jgi:hypothetical protein